MLLLRQEMTARLRPRVAAAILVGGSLLAAAPGARASSGSEFTTVSAIATDGYVREKNPDGSYRAETYAFGKGGLWAGSMRDTSIDNLTFNAIARTLAVPLARQNYIPARDAADAKLLIMVYWGTTAGTRDVVTSDAYQNLQEDQSASAPSAPSTSNPHSSGSAMRTGIQGTPNTYDFGLLTAITIQNGMRDQADWRNAQLLGYDATLLSLGMEGHTALSNIRDDLISEIEFNRYFVVLMAYDFQMTWKQKKHKLLWTTRFSIPQHNNEFSGQLKGMADYASQYFGQNVPGLVRTVLPEGNVEVGVPRAVEDGKDK